METKNYSNEELKNKLIAEGREEDIIICQDCGKVLDRAQIDTFEQYADDFYCLDCFAEDFEKCDDCGEYVPMGDLTETANGNKVCEDCRVENYVECDDCGEYYLSSEMTEVGRGRMVCEYCLEDNYTECHDCGEYVHNDDIRSVNEGAFYVCEECACDYYYCDECGGYFDSDHICEDTDGYYYCEECRNCGYGNFEDSAIHSYHNSHAYAPVFFSTENGKVVTSNFEKLDTLYLGVEIECDGGDRSNSVAVAQAMQEKLNIFDKDFVTMESDGSLDTGFETITQPATLEFHKNNMNAYEEAFRSCIQGGFTSHKNGNCGLHIHFNRSFFADNEEEYITKLLYVVEKNWEKLTKFSRRKLPQLDRWAKKYTESPEQVVETGKLYANSKAKVKYRDRYYAINLTNDNTIEFRLFRGSMRPETFIATLQLVDILVKFVKENDIRTLQRTEFESYLQTPELKAYWETVKDRAI